MRALRNLEHHHRGITRRVHLEIVNILDGRTPDALARAASHAHTAMDDEERRVIARSHTAPPACSAGCSSCCHVNVDVTPPEVLAIAHHLQRTWSREAQITLRQRLAEHAAKTDALSDDERWQAKIPCALLGSDGRCTIHVVRPLRCRAFHSPSASLCQEAFAGVGDAAPVRNLLLSSALEAVEAGYDEALAASGVPGEPSRLEGALLRALG